ncbi:MAG: beta-galactosidase, partial [Ilumatobacteraceae bacterium]|nr:beta-galactosidase [Ilumatobacteraceae bacterium]
WYAPAGHLVAWDQVELRRARPARRQRSVRGATPTAAIDDLVTMPVELTLWRAATDNDGFKLMPELAQRLRVGGQGLKRWQAAGVDSTPADELVDHIVERCVADDGSVVYHHRVEVPDSLAGLPRIGVRFGLPARFDQLRWCGRGPHENYPDRLASAMVGTWQGSPDHPPYLVPQEFGLRCDTRWLECIDSSSGQTVRIDVLEPATMHVSATNYRAEDLFVAANQADLHPREELVVHLDVAHRGLGTASCGPDVLPEYELPSGTFTFAYRLSLQEPN